MIAEIKFGPHFLWEQMKLKRHLSPLIFETRNVTRFPVKGNCRSLHHLTAQFSSPNGPSLHCVRQSQVYPFVQQRQRTVIRRLLR